MVGTRFIALFFGGICIACLAFGGAAASGQSGGSGSISGIVLDENGQPLADVCVHGGSPAGSESTTTGGDGRYTLANLTASNWTISFGFNCAPGGDQYVHEYYDDVQNWGTRTEITIASGAAVTGIDAQANLPGRIEGRVTNRSGDPVAGMCARAFKLGEANPIAVEHTGADGRYALEVPARDYKIDFLDCSPEAPQYLRQSYNGRFDGTADTVHLTGGTLAGIDARMQRAPSISGHIQSESGAPLANVCVNAFIHPPPDSGQVLHPVGKSDASGRYTIVNQLGNLTPGTAYKLMAFDCGPQVQDPFHTPGFPQMWWGGADLDSAQTIVLGEEEDRDGIDFRIPATGRVTGHAVDAEGKPVSGACIEAIQGGAKHRAAISDVNGEFKSIPVPVGTYALRIFSCVPFGNARDLAPEYWNDRPRLETADTVEIKSGETLGGIDVELTLNGPDPCVVPPLEGKRLAKAEQRLVAAQCSVGRIKETDADARAGRVVDSTPDKGAVRQHQKKVKLAVAR